MTAPYSPAWVAACYGRRSAKGNSPKIDLADDTIAQGTHAGWQAATRQAALRVAGWDPSEDWENDHGYAEHVARMMALYDAGDLDTLRVFANQVLGIPTLHAPDPEREAAKARHPAGSGRRTEAEQSLLTYLRVAEDPRHS
jgi:hypothetical protein